MRRQPRTLHWCQYSAAPAAYIPCLTTKTTTQREANSTQTVWSAGVGSSRNQSPHRQPRTSRAAAHSCAAAHTTPVTPALNLPSPSPSPFPHPHPPATRCPHLSVSDASACKRLLNCLRMHKQQTHTHYPSAPPFLQLPHSCARPVTATPCHIRETLAATARTQTGLGFERSPQNNPGTRQAPQVLASQISGCQPLQ